MDRDLALYNTRTKIVFRKDVVLVKTIRYVGAYFPQKVRAASYGLTWIHGK